MPILPYLFFFYKAVFAFIEHCPNRSIIHVKCYFKQIFPYKNFDIVNNKMECVICTSLAFFSLVVGLTSVSSLNTNSRSSCKLASFQQLSNIAWLVSWLIFGYHFSLHLSVNGALICLLATSLVF